MTGTPADPPAGADVDTPEKSGYAGRAEVAQPKLELCRKRLEEGFFPRIPDGLRRYPVDRLDGDSAARHLNAAEQASVGAVDRSIGCPCGCRRALRRSLAPLVELVEGIADAELLLRRMIRQLDFSPIFLGSPGGAAATLHSSLVEKLRQRATAEAAQPGAGRSYYQAIAKLIERARIPVPTRAVMFRFAEETTQLRQRLIRRCHGEEG